MRSEFKHTDPFKSLYNQQEHHSLIQNRLIKTGIVFV